MKTFSVMLATLAITAMAAPINSDHFIRNAAPSIVDEIKELIGGKLAEIQEGNDPLKRAFISDTIHSTDKEIDQEIVEEEEEEKEIEEEIVQDDEDSQ
jgi:hypothetical protein